MTRAEHEGRRVVRGRLLDDWVIDLEDPARRDEALEAIEALGARAAPALAAVVRVAKRLVEPRTHARWVAAKILAAIGSRAIPSLTRLLADENAGGIALMALQRIGPAGRRVCLRAIRSTSPVSRRLSCLAMAKMGVKARGVVAALRRALGDGDAGVRGEAASALIGMGFRQRRLAQVAVDGARVLLSRHPGWRDWRWTTEGGVNEVLTKTGFQVAKLGSASVPALVRALDDPSLDVKVWAVDTFEALGTEAVAAVGPLMRQVSSAADIHVRLGAASALCRIAPDSAPLLEALRKELRGFPGANPAHAALLMERLGTRAADAVPDLVRELRGRGLVRRQMAAFALRAISPLATAAIPALEAALDDRDVKVRTFAAGALVKMDVKTAAVARVLAKALADTSHKGELQAAILGLKALGPVARCAVRPLRRIVSAGTAGTGAKPGHLPDAIRALAASALRAIESGRGARKRTPPKTRSQTKRGTLRAAGRSPGRASWASGYRHRSRRGESGWDGFQVQQPLFGANLVVEVPQEV